MNMTPDEARLALEDAGRVAENTRTVAALAGTDIIVMLWGAIWVAGFLWSHIVTVAGWPGIFHAGWFLLVAVGVTAMIVAEKRRQPPIKNTVGRRIGLFWWTLYGYCYLGLSVLCSNGNQVLLHSGPNGSKAMAAINALIPMFAYVVMGLWLEQNFFIWIGLGLTALTAAAYFLFLPVFFPLMAVAGGGVLFGCGFWMRLRVRRTMTGRERHA